MTTRDAGDGAAPDALAARLREYFRDTPPAPDASASARAEEDPLRGMWLEGDSLAPFVVTPLGHVLRALELADVMARDTLLDVGCGDGRVVVAAAALRGARAVGVELEPHVAALAQRALTHWAAETGGNASVRCGDATSDGALAGATVVFAALLPDGVAVLAPALAAARRAGARLVTLHFPLPGGEPPAASDAVHRLFFYAPLLPPQAAQDT